jgi:putative SOS response-associated peptidase YedK
MCGRYRLSRRKQIIAEHFDAVPFEDDWEPRYNIATECSLTCGRKLLDTADIVREAMLASQLCPPAGYSC